MPTPPSRYLKPLWLLALPALLLFSSCVSTRYYNQRTMFRLTDSQQSSRVDLMFVGLISLAILGKVTDMMLHAIEGRTLRWRDTLATQARP